MNDDELIQELLAMINDLHLYRNQYKNRTLVQAMLVATITALKEERLETLVSVSAAVVFPKANDAEKLLTGLIEQPTK